jgi:hypothetical protein
VGMTGFDGEGWPRMASRGALPPLTTEQKSLSAKNTFNYMFAPQALAQAPLAA